MPGALQVTVLAAILLMQACAPARAGWGELVEDFFKLFARSGPALERAGARIAEESIETAAPLTREVLGKEQFARLSAQDALEFEGTIARIGAGRIQALQEGLALLAGNARHLDKSVPFDASLPFLRVRATGIASYDDALVSFAHIHLTPSLEQRFAVEDLHIVPLGMSEDAAISAREVAEYTNWLPTAQRDVGGPLARLGRGELGELDFAGKATALTPYRGQTVVLVGHVLEGDGRFVTWSAKGMQPIDLSDWMKAAAEAQVNLIPIGCNSGHFLEFGAADFVNSASVLQRLLKVISEKPQTVREFLATLSGNDLELLIDPTNIKIFGNTVEILKRESQERVGRILTNLKRQAPSIGGRLYNVLQRAESYPDYRPCFANVDATSFDGCTAHARTVFENDLAAKASVEKARADEILRLQRNQLLDQLPKARTALATSEARALRTWVLYSLYFLVVWLLAAFLAPYSHVVWSWQNQTDTGLSTWRAFTDAQTLQIMLPLVFSREYWKEILASEGNFFLVLPLLMGFAVLATSLWNVCDYDSDSGLVLGGCVIYCCASMLFWVLISLLRSEAGVSLWFSFLVTSAMLGVAWPVYVSGDALGRAHDATKNLAALWAVIQKDDLESWRNEIEYKYYLISDLIKQSGVSQNDEKQVLTPVKPLPK